MEQDIKTKIAFWYYSCGLTQEEIARRLSLTRQKVNAIIGALKDDGIVTVSIRGCERDYPEWEHLLEEHFDLEQVVADGRAAWNEALGQIRVEGGTEDERTTFYTALYRCYERMINISEDGRYYSAWDGQVH
jgi:DNA-binding transcriptional regulator LsrR (DeoR family)